MKQRISWRRVVALAVTLALMLSDIPGTLVSYASWETEIPQTISRVVYVEGNGGAAPAEESAYDTLEEAMTALSEEDSAEDALIVVLGTVTSNVSFNLQGNENHTGTYYITGKYGIFDGGGILFEKNSGTNYNFGGPVVMENITLKQSRDKVLNFHSSTSLTIGSGVVTDGYTERMSVVGGSYHKDVKHTVIKVGSGDWGAVRAGNNTRDITDTAVITVGGTVEITVVAASGNGEVNVENAIVNVNGGKVNTVYVTGTNAKASAGNVTVNLNAGTISNGVSVCDDSVNTGDLIVTLDKDVVQGESFTMNLEGVELQGKSTLNLGKVSKLPLYAEQFDNVNAMLSGEGSRTVLYVDGTVLKSGDGRSASTAFATLQEAYAYIAAHSPEDGGTIVICGDLRIDDDLDLESNYDISGTVEITSKYEGEDYSSSVTVDFGAAVYFYPTSRTNLHDITFYSEGVTYFYTGEDMVIGENIRADAAAKKYGLKLFCTRRSGSADDQINVTVNSGTYHSIYMGGNTGSISGNIELTMDGGEVTTYFVTGANSSKSKPSSTGDLIFVMRGGEIATLCDTPNTGGSTGEVELHLIGGTISSGMTVYGSGDNIMESIAVNLYESFEEVPSAFGNWGGADIAGGAILNVSGYSGEVPLGGYDAVNIKENASVSYSGELGSQKITVDFGSELMLTYPAYTEADSLPEKVTITAAIGGTITDGDGGTVYYSKKQYPEVVYVNGSAAVSGDGLSDETPVKTLHEAWSMLNPVEGGTVVVCGVTDITGNTTNLESCGISGPVTLTAVYQGTDYAVQNGAKLVFGSKAYIYFGDETHIQDITMDGSAGTVYFYCGPHMEIGEDVNAFGTLKLFCCNSAPAAAPEEAEDVSLVVSSGYYDTIFMGANTADVYVGDVDVTICDDASMRLLVVGGNNGHTGDLTVNMNGGTITSKMCNTPNKEGCSVGDVVINLSGGAIKSMVGYNSSVHYGKSATINVDMKAAKNIPASLGYWDAFFLPGTTTRVPLTLNYLNYDGSPVSSSGYDVVNLFAGGSVPEDYKSTFEAGKRILCIQGYEGISSVDLSDFDKLMVSGGADVICADKVPVSLALVADNGILRIRPSQNPGVVLADYERTLVNGGQVFMEEPAYTSHDVIFSADFENAYALADGNGIKITPVNNGYTTAFANGGFTTGFDGNTALYIVNEFGKNAFNYICYDLSESGYDITKEDYTVSFWYKTENGGNDQWGRGIHATIAGTDVDMPSYNMGGVIFSNQDTHEDTDGMSFLQLTQYKYVAAGFTGTDGTHCDADGIWQAQDDSWHHVAVSYDRDGFCCIYVDGKLTAVSDISAYAGERLGENILVFGADVLGQYGLGNAILDDIVVFDGSLNIIDVQAEYYASRIYALAQEIETRLEELGDEYSPYKAEMRETVMDTLSQAELLGADRYQQLIPLYNELVSAYETFLEEPQEEAMLTMLLSSDMHLGASGTSENLNLVLSQLKELGIDIDVLLSAGDFADSPITETVNGAYQEMEELLTRYGMTDTLFVNSLGNHDAYYKDADANYQTAVPLYWQYMMQHMEEMIQDGAVTLDHASYYVDDDGIVQSCSYAVTFHGYHFLVINTDYLPQTGNSADYKDENGEYSIEGNAVDPIRHTMHISDESFQWMEEVLDSWAEDGMPVFAVSHYLFKDTAPLSFDSEIIINSNTVGKQDQQLRELLAGYDNVFYFCGHLHATFGVLEPYKVTVDEIGSFWEINLSSLKASSRGYLSIPSTWIMYVYEDEVVLRARDFATGQWLTRFDEVIKLYTDSEPSRDETEGEVDGASAEDNNNIGGNSDSIGEDNGESGGPFKRENDSKTPVAGDGTKPVFWILMLASSVCAGAGVVCYRRRFGWLKEGKR